MELGKQIRKYRNDLSLSQDELAEKVFVSRQTISNWENDKSYPDVKSLCLLSEIFQVSLDQLIKGDVEKMREQMNQEDKRKFEQLSRVYTVLFFVMIISPVPLVYFWGIPGLVIWAGIMIPTIVVAVLVEKQKKKFDIQTYREIVAFMDGTSLNEIEKAREEGKRPYQKILLAAGSGVVTLAIAVLLGWVLGL